MYPSADVPQCRCTPVPMYPSAEISTDKAPLPIYPSADLLQCRNALPTKLYRQSSTDKALPTKLYRQTHKALPTKLYRQTHKALPTKLYRQTHKALPTNTQSSTDKALPTNTQSSTDKALPTKLHCRSTPLPIDSSAKLLQCRSTPVPKSSTVPLDFVNCIRKIPYPKLHKRETRPQQCDSVPPFSPRLLGPVHCLVLTSAMKYTGFDFNFVCDKDPKGTYAKSTFQRRTEDVSK
jgi:hypothetical protein